MLWAAMTSKVARFLLAAFSVIAATGLLAGNAAAETAYRYWSYWQAAGSTWAYASEGSGTRVPNDGDVEGWRFGIAGDPEDINPRPMPDFQAICGSVAPQEDTKRVAVVIDFGESGQAPDGEQPPMAITDCVAAEPSATGYQILTRLADVRTDAGFICGINGYPSSECAALVEVPDVSAPSASPTATPQTPTDTDATASTAQAAPTASPSQSGTPLITAAVISVLAVLGFGLWRRSRHGGKHGAH